MVNEGVIEFKGEFAKLENDLSRLFLAETLGTFVYTLLGCLGNVFVTFRGEGAAILFSPVTWGLAYTCGYYVSGGVSGGHFNPAISLSRFFRPSRFRAMLIYWAAQYLGAFLGSVGAVCLSWHAIYQKHGERYKTDPSVRQLFAPYASEDMNDPETLFATFVSTFFFTLLFHAILDYKNMQIDEWFIGFLVGVTNLTAIGLAFGYVNGARVNPALDVMPRLLTWWLGVEFWSDGFFYHLLHWIIYHLAAVVAAVVYSISEYVYWGQSTATTIPEAPVGVSDNWLSRKFPQLQYGYHPKADLRYQRSSEI